MLPPPPHPAIKWYITSCFSYCKNWKHASVECTPNECSHCFANNTFIVWLSYGFYCLISRQDLASQISVCWLYCVANGKLTLWQVGRQSKTRRRLFSVLCWQKVLGLVHSDKRSQFNNPPIYTSYSSTLAPNAFTWMPLSIPTHLAYPSSLFFLIVFEQDWVSFI